MKNQTSNITDEVAEISAKHGDRKYKTTVPLKYKVDENSAKAQYTNGILELTLSLAEEKPKGKCCQSNNEVSLNYS